MKDHLKKALKARLSLVLNFVEGKTKEYKHHDLMNDVKTTFLKVEDLPCEFSLMLGDKSLVNKAKNSYHNELWDFVKESNKTWEFFTGDHTNPVPNVFGHDVEKYNPTLAFYAMKKNGVLWTKKSGLVRVDYLKHLLMELENAN